MSINMSRANAKTTLSLQGPSGNPEFAVRFYVKDFKPEVIHVFTKSGKLTISGKILQIYCFYFTVFLYHI